VGKENLHSEKKFETELLAMGAIVWLWVEMEYLAIIKIDWKLNF
jgi:hypothetical protein